MSQVSLMSGVEMAQDEVFSGPMSESVPTSISSFAHRRQRADSTTSFRYYDEDFQNSDEAEIEEAIIDEYGDIDDYDGYAEQLDDLEAGMSSSSPRRKSSMHSRRSVDAPLLRRHSVSSSGSGGGWKVGRTNQKIYIITEDLTIVVAGFKTSTIGLGIYAVLCTLTVGLLWLVFRWVPRWRIWLTGRHAPLKDCDWVVIENQWGEFAIQNVDTRTYGRSLSTVFGDDEKVHRRDYDEDEDPVLNELRSLDYRYIRFCFHPLKDKFVLANTWKDPSWTDAATLRNGLNSEERDYRALVFGRNAVEIEDKSISQLLVDEAFHPFYVFQIASLLLWSLDQYYYYAACIFIISVVSITTTLIETKATMKRLREVSRFECDVRVLRNGFWRTVDSTELVPGDVYEVTDPRLSQLPCDSLLLSGDCIVNESMLTGESIPVSKTPVTNEALDLLDLSASTMHPEVAKHVLFCGTKIIRARRPHDDTDDEAAALAMVIRVGFNTTKGALVRSMLFPKPSGFKFYRDSFRYISVMAGIALIGFTFSFINFVHLGLAWHLVVVRALDLITIVVPPALPATLSIGTNFALSRLKQRQIFCISPQRVNVGGKLDVVCFDKTGTLTEEGLDVLGVRVVHRPENRFSDILTQSSDVYPSTSYERDPTVDYEVHKAILYAMATCHSLRVIDDELVGDPLDVKMFNFTGWSFEEGEHRSTGGDEEPDHKLSPSVARPPPGTQYGFDENSTTESPPKAVELGVLKTFEFVSQLRRASVVVRQFGSRSGSVYVKGAPESMKDICRPDSLPSDYEDLLGYYTHRGFRVIACATKTIQKLNWLKVQKMNRTEAENDLTFVGFIVFENKLKPSTTPVIEELGRAGIRKVMCTGDNILTAISVARECGLIHKTAHCFVPHFIEGDSRTALSRLSWQSVDDPLFKLDENTLKPLPADPETDASLPYAISDVQNYSLAISGDVFRWVIDFASEKVLHQMLVSGQVFARMSPDEKHELVEKLQGLDYCCGFCGDGANDCGALKAADVGISLSEAEASVAAPFTSRVFDISCVPQVIKEGRAALVTSFSCFKYMSLYSAIQFTSVSFLYASASNLGDFQFLFIDLLLILPIAIFMGWSGAYPQLSRKRPTASLVSRKVLTPLLGQIVLCVVIQAIGFKFVQRQPWYEPPVVDKDKSNSHNSQNTTLFLLSCYQYILSAVVLSVGRPFRQPMSQNVPFVTTMVITLLITTYMLFDPAQWLIKLMDLTFMSTDFRFLILALGVGNFAIAYLNEKYLLPALAKGIGLAKIRINPKWRKTRKAYKEIQEGKRL